MDIFATLDTYSQKGCLGSTFLCLSLREVTEE